MAFPNKATQFKQGRSGNPGGRPKGTTKPKPAITNLSFDQARLNLAEEHRANMSIRCELLDDGTYKWIVRTKRARGEGGSIREALDKFAEKVGYDIAPGEPVEFRAYMYRRTEDDYRR